MGFPLTLKTQFPKNLNSLLEMSSFHLIVLTDKFFIRNFQPDQLFQLESFLGRLKTLFIFPALSVGSEAVAKRKSIVKK